MSFLTAKGFRHLMESTYTDQEGLISPDKNPGRWTSGNGALDTAWYYVILFLAGELRESDSIKIASIYSNLWHEGRAGLLARNKGRPDQDAWDNYLGACVAGLLCDALTVPRAIREYGESHCWTFQNEPGLTNMLKGTLWRFPGLVPIIKLCASDARPPGNIELAGLGYRLGEPAENPGAARTKALMCLVVFYAFGEVSHPSLREKAAFQLRCIRNRFGSLTGMLTAYHGVASPFSQIDVQIPAWLHKGVSI